MTDFGPVSLPPFDNGPALQRFALAHSLEHDRLLAAANALGIGIDAYPLIPLPSSALGLQQWLMGHNLVHLSLAGGQGITTSTDLADVDWTKKEEFNFWMYLHSQIHAGLAQLYNLPP